MKVLLLFLLASMLFGDALYFKFCTKDDTVGCLIYKADNNKSIESLSPPTLEAINGDVSFIEKQQIDNYTVYLYKIDYRDFLLVDPIRLNGEKSQRNIYSFTDRTYKNFDDFLEYGYFRYDPAWQQRKKFQKNILLSLFLIFPLYFVFLIAHHLSQKNKALERMGLQRHPTNQEEARKFYRFLMLEGLPNEIESFNKEIGTSIFERKSRKKGKQRNKPDIKSIQKAFTAFLDRYTHAKKFASHLKRVFLLYLWSVLVFGSWIYFDKTGVVIFVAMLTTFFVIWMFVS